MTLFHGFSHINWSRAVWVLGGLSGIWALAVEFVPGPWFKGVAFGLAAASFSITYFIRPTVYVPDRKEQS